MGVVSSTSSVHRALQGMLYSIKKLHNKTKRKDFVVALNSHIDNGSMIIFHDETNFNLSRVGDRATVALPPSKGKTCMCKEVCRLLLLKPHEGSIKKEENARFIADLFLAALRSEEYRELGSSKKVVIVTDNAPAQSGIDELAFKVLAEDGIVNLNRLAILRLGPKSPM
ncbi:Transposase [Phytophthora palmivora]|uniref:Transposase n=1 Tax=Phytophthora palmivora TaxID=4796 RepID=A0A2P4YI83_9STRA|nr:Transposase [Phytophthora palmivora]